MGNNISEQGNRKLHSDLFKKDGKVLFGKKKFTIPPNADRPSATSRPEVFQENEQFVLRWDPPATDNGCPIIGYIIEHLELGLPQLTDKEVDETTQWYSSEPGQVTNTECLLNNLIPGTTYQFRIIAENIIGYSPPSDSSDPIVYNPFGELDDYFSLPKFLVNLNEAYTVMKGEKLTLSVEVEGQPYPILHWYDRNEMEIAGHKTCAGRKRSLTFNSVDLNDAGKVTCSAENYLGSVTSSTIVVVEAPPHVTSPDNSDRLTPGAGAIFQSGELVRLKFNYSGSPSPEVSLYHNGELVVENERITIEKSDDSVVVKIASGTRDDRGEYTIQLQNDLGEDNASSMLTITDRPSPPVSKPEVLQLSDNSCVLQWQDPVDDGGCPIQNYIVEYFRNGWGVWLKAVTTKGHTTKIRDLIPGSKYKFRVKAENLYGVSEASEESVELLITDLPSIIRSGDDGLMKTVEEEEMEVMDESEELRPPPIPPRTRDSSTEKSTLSLTTCGTQTLPPLEKRRSPVPPPPLPVTVTSVPVRTTLPNRFTPEINFVAPRESKSSSLPSSDPFPVKFEAVQLEKKVFSRREILGTPFNYLTLEPELPTEERPLTPTKSPVDEELEKLKELLNEHSDYEEEEEEDDEDEEFTYDFEKLQKEYEEDMLKDQEQPHEEQRQETIIPKEDIDKRLPVFKEITDRWNSLSKEMEGVIREFSETRELGPEEGGTRVAAAEPMSPDISYHDDDYEDEFIDEYLSDPDSFFLKPSSFENDNRLSPSRTSEKLLLESPNFSSRSPVPPPISSPERSPIREINIRSPYRETKAPERSPIRYSRTPEKSPYRETALAQTSVKPEHSPNRQLAPPPVSEQRSFEPENSPYRELPSSRTPERQRSPQHRREIPSHSPQRSRSPSPEFRESKGKKSREQTPLLHDRFTDYLTMKIKDHKIASSMTNIHNRSRSRSTSRPVSPTRSASSLQEDYPSRAKTTTGVSGSSGPSIISSRYESDQFKDTVKLRNRSADLQRKYNTMDNRQISGEDDEYALEQRRLAASKSYEYIDEVGSEHNLVVTECSLTVPLTLRPGSHIELWRSDSALDNPLDIPDDDPPQLSQYQTNQLDYQQEQLSRSQEQQHSISKQTHSPIPIKTQEKFQQPIKAQEQFQQPIKTQEQFQQPIKAQEQFQQPIKTQEQFQQPIKTQGQFEQPTKTQEQFEQPIKTQGQLFEQSIKTQVQFEQPIKTQEPFEQPTKTSGLVKPEEQQKATIKVQQQEELTQKEAPQEYVPPPSPPSAKELRRKEAEEKRRAEEEKRRAEAELKRAEEEKLAALERKRIAAKDENLNKTVWGHKDFFQSTPPKTPPPPKTIAPPTAAPNLDSIEREDGQDGEEWLKQRRGRPRPYIKHYEEIINEEAAAKKVQEEIDDPPREDPSERAERARRQRQRAERIMRGEPSQDPDSLSDFERSTHPEDDFKDEESVADENGTEMASESLLSKYRTTLIRTALYMILSPLLFISVPFTALLLTLLIVSHYFKQ